jgi:hypothetical protein
MTQEEVLSFTEDLKADVVRLRQVIDPKDDLAKEIPLALVPARDIPWDNIAVDNNLREIEEILVRTLTILNKKRFIAYEVVNV